MTKLLKMTPGTGIARVMMIVSLKACKYVVHGRRRTVLRIGIID